MVFFVRKRSGIPKSLTITLGLKKEQRASGESFFYLVNKNILGIRRSERDISGHIW